MVRRSIIVAASLMFCLCLAACGSSGTNDPTGNNNNNPSYGGCMVDQDHECIEWPVAAAYATGCTNQGNTWHESGCPAGYKGTCKFGDTTSLYGYSWRVYEGADLTSWQQTCQIAGGTWSAP